MEKQVIYFKSINNGENNRTSIEIYNLFVFCFMIEKFIIL